MTSSHDEIPVAVFQRELSQCHLNTETLKHSEIIWNTPRLFLKCRYIASAPTTHRKQPIFLYSGERGAAWFGSARRKHRSPYCCAIAVPTDICCSTTIAWRKYAKICTPHTKWTHNNQSWPPTFIPFQMELENTEWFTPRRLRIISYEPRNNLPMIKKLDE
jgi:hypothetical protein